MNRKTRLSVLSAGVIVLLIVGLYPLAQEKTKSGMTKEVVWPGGLVQTNKLLLMS